jgi:shikimate dehydrogenase
VNHHYSLQDKVICILGAGGAAAGILAPLLEQAPRELVVCNRTLERAQILCERFNHSACAPQALSFSALNAFAENHPIDWIINATPATAESTVLPLLPHVVKNARIYELTYSKNGKTTPFAAWARQHGAIETIDGLGMLVEQAAEGFAIWHPGKHPVTQDIIAQLQKDPT